MKVTDHVVPMWDLYPIITQSERGWAPLSGPESEMERSTCEQLIESDAKRPNVHLLGAGCNVRCLDRPTDDGLNRRQCHHLTQQSGLTTAANTFLP